MSATRCNGKASCVSFPTVDQKKKPPPPPPSSSSFSSAAIQKQKWKKQEELEEDELMKSKTTCNFRMPRKKDLSPPLKYLKQLGGKMVGVLRMISSSRRTSPKVTNSSEVRPKPSVAPLDSHRAEAIDDCIEFINSSSSSLPRSNSTTK